MKDANAHFILFAEHVAHDGRNFGWGYNLSIGQTSDNPTDDGINIPAFDGGTFDDQGQHHMKVVVNGATAKLYLDDVFGAEVSFPFGQELTFGFGAYVDDTGNIVRGYFDNARITGGSAPVGGRLSAATQGADIVISWTGTGVLQFTDSLTPLNWQDVNPPPTGSSVTVTPGTQGNRFYRLR